MSLDMDTDSLVSGTDANADNGALAEPDYY